MDIAKIKDKVEQEEYANLVAFEKGPYLVMKECWEVQKKTAIGKEDQELVEEDGLGEGHQNQLGDP